MSDIDEQTRSSDPLGGHERKMKIMRLITTQKINFRRRKPSANANSSPYVYPVKSATEHRSEIEPVGSRKPLGRSFFGRDSGDDPTDSPELSPGRSELFNEEPLSTPVEKSYVSPNDSRGRSQTLNNISTDSSSVPLDPSYSTIEFNDSPSMRYDSNPDPDPANQTPIIESKEQNSSPVIRTGKVCEEDEGCFPCGGKNSGCSSKFCCLLQIILTLICLLCAYYLWYYVTFLPPFCGCLPRNTQCDLDPPRWII